MLSGTNYENYCIPMTQGLSSPLQITYIMQKIEENSTK